MHGFEVAEHLRRGIQIARVLGWDKEKSVVLRELVSTFVRQRPQPGKMPVASGGSLRWPSTTGSRAPPRFQRKQNGSLAPAVTST